MFLCLFWEEEDILSGTFRAAGHMKLLFFWIPPSRLFSWTISDHWRACLDGLWSYQSKSHGYLTVLRLKLITQFLPYYCRLLMVMIILTLNFTSFLSVLQDTLPYNDYFEYFGPDYRLHLPVSNMENLNSAKYLEDIKIQVKFIWILLIMHIWESTIHAQI